MCTIQKVLKSVEHCPLTCQCPSPQAISVTSLLEIPPGMFCDTVYTLQFGLVCGVGHEPWGLTTSPAHSTRHPRLRVKKHHCPGGGHCGEEPCECVQQYRTHCQTRSLSLASSLYSKRVGAGSVSWD